MALMQDLSSAVKAIVSQRLVPALSGGARAAAVEVMVNSRAVAELIETGRIGEIKDAMDNSMSPGSQSFEQALVKLVRDGAISADEALANADSATNLLWQLNNAKEQPAADAASGNAAASASFTGFTLNT